MNISLEGKSAKVIEHLVETGRYASPSAVVDDLVHQHQQREQDLHALRASIEASLAEEGDLSEAEFEAAIAATLEALKREGF